METVYLVCNLEKVKRIWIASSDGITEARSDKKEAVTALQNALQKKYGRRGVSLTINGNNPAG